MGFGQNSWWCNLRSTAPWNLLCPFSAAKIIVCDKEQFETYKRSVKVKSKSEAEIYKCCLNTLNMFYLW